MDEPDNNDQIGLSAPWPAWMVASTGASPTAPANPTAQPLPGAAQSVAQSVAQPKAPTDQEASNFMALMSHQLRTPLNAVLGFSRLLREDPQEPLSANQSRRLAQIEEAGQRLLRLTDRLLESLLREDPVTVPGWQWVGTAQQAQTQTAQPTPPTQPTQPTPPAPPAPPAPPNTARSDLVSLASTRLRVLYVEDNAVNRLLVQEIMALRPGLHLRCAPDGLSGVAMAVADPPDVVLLDMQLPDIPGLEVHRQIRQHAALNHCKVIALSANLLPESQRAARAAGLEDYWTKPIQFDRFLARIDALATAIAETHNADPVLG